MYIMSKNDNVEAGVGISVIFLWIIAICGWVANVVKLIGMISVNEPITTMFIARCVGVFAAPFGAILGFF